MDDVTPSPAGWTGWGGLWKDQRGDTFGPTPPFFVFTFKSVLTWLLRCMWSSVFDALDVSGRCRSKPAFPTVFSTPSMRRYRGIEPLASVWKTEVLPLYEYREFLLFYRLVLEKSNPSSPRDVILAPPCFFFPINHLVQSLSSSHFVTGEQGEAATCGMSSKAHRSGKRKLKTPP